jgi:hypothetical protein
MTQYADYFHVAAASGSGFVRAKRPVLGTPQDSIPEDRNTTTFPDEPHAQVLGRQPGEIDDTDHAGEIRTWGNPSMRGSRRPMMSCTWPSKAWMTFLPLGVRMRSPNVGVGKS